MSVQISQHGTPFGAITLLNQARISGGTWPNWPLSTASAVLASVERQASKTNGASLRIRSSAASYPCGQATRDS